MRWHQIDDGKISKGTWAIHSFLLGVVNRYIIVFKSGIQAMKSGNPYDFQVFHQQQNDVCMLRLFDSFTESAPQLVFYLYVMMEWSYWPTHQIAWTAVSALASLVSLGWGIAAYSSAMRMVQLSKTTLSWTGMILQTMWRFGMISARLVALVLMSLALKEWTILVICKYMISLFYYISFA